MSLYSELLSVLASALPLTPLVLAALPPLSDGEREAEAQLVVVGVIQKVKTKDVKVEGGTDVDYTVELKVEAVEKMILGELSEGPIFLRFRQTGNRPGGWTGPSGQHSLYGEGERVRVFATFAPDGTFWLIEPNGWEEAAAPAKKEKPAQADAGAGKGTPKKK